MIQINVEKNKDSISRIVIKGHSGYAESGSDIVCASVSSIATTTINAILRIDPDALSYKEEEGFLEIIRNRQDEIISLLLTNMLELLEELQKQYSKYIKIIK